MDKEKKGHLNPAFHLKVVGPINKSGGHKGVSGEILWQLWEKMEGMEGGGLVVV